jgi:hypothetical protein
MLYELHITVNPHSNLSHWQRWCSTRGYKPLLIDLLEVGEGEQPLEDPRQMMFAVTFEGTHEEAVQWREATASLVSDEFQIIRDKLEVPLDKSLPFHSPAYYETHVKALVDPECIGGNLRDAASFGWAASRNALFENDHGYEKWYYTKRFYPDKRGLPERDQWWPYNFRNAAIYFHREYADVSGVLGGTMRMEMEAVISDSNPDLDKGWA